MNREQNADDKTVQQMTTTTKAKSVVLSLLMVTSVLAVGTAGLGGTAAAQSQEAGIVDPDDPNNIDIIRVNGEPIDPINGSNNDQADIPRVQTNDTITIELNVTDNANTPQTVNATLTTDPQNVFSGATTGANGTVGGDGVRAIDGGSGDLDGDGAPNGRIVTTLEINASGGFGAGDVLSIATSTADSNGNFQTGSGGNQQNLDPAVRIDGEGPFINDPDIVPNEVAGTDGSGAVSVPVSTSGTTPDLVAAKTTTPASEVSSTAVHPGEQVRVIAQVNQSQQTPIKNVSADVSGLGIANVTNGGGTPVNDNVTMFRDVNRDGVITSADDTDNDGEFIDQVGPNGTYIGQFYANISSSGTPAVDVNAFEVQTENPRTVASDTITVNNENHRALEVHAQPGEDRVTVVFTDNSAGEEVVGVATNADGTGKLSVEDFRYVDTTGLTGGTSITDVEHEAGKSVAVLELDAELTERDVATLRSSDSEFDERHGPETGTAEPTADMIRLEADQIFTGVERNTESPDPLFDSSSGNGAAGTDFTIFEANATALNLSATEGSTGTGDFRTERPVNPEETFFVNASVSTSQEQLDRPAISIQVTDRSGNLERKNSVSAQLVDDVDVTSFPSEEESGEEDFTVTGGDRLSTDGEIATAFDLRRFPPKGAADGPLNVSVQASGEFTAADNTSSVRYNESALEFANASNPPDVNFDGIIVDAVRPIEIDATANPGGGTAGDADTIQVDFSEDVTGTNDNPINSRDLEYISGDGNEPREIVSVDRVRGLPGGDLITVRLNDSLTTSRDLSADRIRVVPNQIVDADESGRAIGNPSREGLATGTTDIEIEDGGPSPRDSVTAFPEPVRGDGSLIVRANQDLSTDLFAGGTVTFRVTDESGETITKSIRDGVFFGGLGDISSRTNTEDGVFVTRIFLSEFSGGNATGDVTVEVRGGGPNNVNNDPFLSSSETVDVDNRQPELTEFSPASVDPDNRQAELTFDEGVFGAQLSEESIDEDYFDYVDNSLTGASQIEDVDHTAGSDTIVLTLNGRTDPTSLEEDRIRVVREEFVEDESGNIGVFGSTETGFTSTTPVDGGDGGDGTPGDGGDGGDGTPGDGGDGGDGTPGDGGDGGDSTFTEPLPGAGDGAQAPTDTDGDGQFEDVNGDGTADFDDAVALAFAGTSQLNDQQRDALDFDGDGDVDFDDAVELAFST